MSEALLDRRTFMRLAGLGGVVFSAALAGCTLGDPRRGAAPFYFVQVSDTHWGFQGPAVNPDPRGTLPRAIAEINALPVAPDFIVFTGDLTHTTDDPAERRKRLSEVRELSRQLKVQTLYFLPGEHDASLDRGAAYKEFFGQPYYSFDHKGVHFIALDNVSDPRGVVGEAQIEWLKADLARLDKAQPIVVLTHRPLFDLAPTWDWATHDGAQVLAQLMPFEYVTVFYGHIHQEHHFSTGHINHHAAKGLMFALPAPLSTPKKAPVPWNPQQPYQGLGFRQISDLPPAAPVLREFSLMADAAAPAHSGVAG